MKKLFYDLSIGISANLIVIAGVAVAAFYFKLRISLRSLLALIREFVAPGGLYFYSCRENLKDALGTSDEYITNAQEELIYVGFWLDSLLANVKFGEQLVRMVNGGIKVKIYLINPTSPLLDIYARRVNKLGAHLAERVDKSAKRLAELRAAVIAEHRHNLILYYHDCPISAPCFMLDRDKKERCRILVDHSFINSDDVRCSYGIEIRRQASPLFNFILDQYKDIEETAKEVA